MVTPWEVGMAERLLSLPGPESVVRPSATIRCEPCGIVAQIETWQNTALQAAIENGKPLYAIADVPEWAAGKATGALTLRRYFCPECGKTLRVR